MLNVTNDLNISTWNYSIDGGVNQSFMPNTTINVNDGQHNISVYATVKTGFIDHSMVNFSVDTMASIIDLTSPVEGFAYNVSSILLNVTANENLSVWNYSINGTVNVTIASNSTSINFADGYHNITIYSVDMVGNINSTMVNFSIDTIAPIVGFTSPIEGLIYNTTSISLNATANENISIWSYSLNGSSNVTFIDGNATLGGLSDGAQNVIVSAIDTAGNINSTMVIFSIDTTAPVIELSSPVESFVYNISSINLNATANENISVWNYNLNNTANVTFIDGNATLNDLPDGDYNVTVYAYDEAGNINSSIVNFTVDTTSPVISISSPVEDFVYNTTSISLNATANENISIWSYSLNGSSNVTLIDGNATLGGLSDGAQNVIVSAIDTAGNINSSIVSFTVDITAPIVSISSPIENSIYNTRSVSLNATANENVTWTYSLNGTANVTFNGDKTITDLPDGAHNITVYATDDVVNIGSSVVNFTIDASKPIITISSPSSAAGNYSSSTVPLNVSADKTITSWSYSLNSGVNVSFTPNTSISGLGDRAHTLIVYAEDTVGLVNSSTINFNVSTLYPLIFIDSPHEGRTYLKDSVDLAVSADEAISSWTYSLNNGANATFVPNTTISNLANGIYNLVIYGNNTAGIIGSSMVNFSISVVEPVVEDDGVRRVPVGPSTEPQVNIADREINLVYMIADKKISSTFEDNDVLVDVSFIPTVNGDPINIVIEVLNEPSVYVRSTPGSVVYKHVNIEVGKNDLAGEGHIKDTTVAFKVTRSWLEENNLDISSIALFRYNNDQWDQLPTEPYHEDGDTVYYTAETPGFSPFAIAVAEDEPVAPISVENKDASEDKDTQLPSNYYVAGAIMIVIALLGVIALSRRKKRS